MTGQTWDVALTRVNVRGDSISLVIPAAIGRALYAAGMNRATLEMTADGLLLRPYKSSVQQPGSRRQTVVLPFATTEPPA